MQNGNKNGNAAKNFLQERWQANTQIEKNLIGCLINSRISFNRVVDILSPDHLSRDSHIEIYKAMIRLHQQDREWDVYSIMDELERVNKKVASEYVMELYNSMDARGDVEEYATIITRKATMRKLTYAAQQIAELALHEDPDALEQAQQIIFEISTGADSKRETTFAEAVDDYLDELVQRREDVRNNIALGLSTGFPPLDSLMGGLQPASLYSLGALTGFGKSAFALNLALNIALKSHHVLFYSLEMRTKEIVQRALSIEAEIDNAVLRDATIDDGDMRAIRATAERLKRCDIKMDDSSFSISAIRSKAKRIHARKKLDLIVVDYIQLIENMETKRTKTRAEEVADLSRALKRLAQELDIPVLCLVQLNRSVESRQNMKPKLSDINESGGIARDSDVVMFIYGTEEEMQKREQCVPYVVWVNVAKGRNARLGEIPLKFNPRITKFRPEVIQYEAE